MTRSVIIEDDPFHLEVLSDLLKGSFQDIKILGTGGLSSEGVKLVRSARPDLVFLDIDLPDKSGFEMLEELKDEVFDVIFVTAHEKYALQAHRFDSVGFLLKPITRESLESALEKFKSKRNRHRQGDAFVDLIHEFRNSLDFPQKIAVPSTGEVRYINLRSIVRLEADNGGTIVHIENEPSIHSNRTFDEYESRLKGTGFYRIHDNHIINMRFVRSYMKGEEGFAILEDLTQMPVDKARSAGFTKLLDRLFSQP
jgi:two-component system LytT family response regulator